MKGTLSVFEGYEYDPDVSNVEIEVTDVALDGRVEIKFGYGTKQLYLSFSGFELLKTLLGRR